MTARTPKPRPVRRAPIASIDHAIVGVRDLKQAAIAWRRLGFKLTPRGRHIGWGTANYCVMFIANYVELLGIVDPKEFTNHFDRFLAKRQGLMSVAYGTADAEACAKALRASGVAADGPKELSRLLEAGDDGVIPRFRLVMLPAEATPALSGFVCEHLTPELLRWPGWLDHANGAVALKGLTTIVDEPRALVAPYERLFAGRAITRESGALHVAIGRARLSFVTARAFASLHGAPAPEARAPYPAAMTVGVARLADTAQFFDDYGVPFVRARDGALLIDADHAAGVMLRFEAA